MTQPSWHCVANLGDVNPYKHGGAFVMVDRRGIYDPELWVWDSDDRTLRQYVMEQCAAVPGNPDAVSDNAYHADKPAWWSDSLPAAEDSHGMFRGSLRKMFLASDPVERAEGWLTLIRHTGALDVEGEKMAAKDARALCDRLLKSIRESRNLPDGFNDN